MIEGLVRLLATGSYSLVARTAFPFALVGIVSLALLPGGILEMLGMGFTFSHDKLNHAAAFAALALLGGFGWPKQKLRMIVFVLFVGAAIEVLQARPLAARDMDVFDWIADFAGAICGLAIAAWTNRIAGGAR
ncbi:MULTISPECIES: VanZ family protein [unclassified Mesorhizobium]|uniref:VanZ family protein n=1 Tax=unclassified Mesorhizobium TaxID=325217 RepID=UPI001FDFEAB0|nr:MULTISPECIES: VanZ family protein [unclassified Mesorhizobium]